jgi:HEAT repeat protein
MARAAALISLGQLKSDEYFQPIISVLISLNNQGRPTTDMERQNEQMIASGAITALGYYGKVEAYPTVFQAYGGWYTNDVKKLAKDTLPKLTGDQTAPLVSIITSINYTYPLRYLALQTLNESSSDSAEKAQMAFLAAKWTVPIPAKSAHDKNIMEQIRFTAVYMLVKYGHGTDVANNPELYKLLGYIYRNDGRVNLKLTVADCLGSLGTDAAVNVLAGFADDLNVAKSTGKAGPNEERLVKAVIAALGKTGSQNAQPALIAISNADWRPATKKMARDSIPKV